MKNFKLVLIVAISFLPVWLWAKQISPETARQVAGTQVNLRNQLRSAGELNLVFTKTTAGKANNSLVHASSAQESVLYYVFNVGDKGFVIVSGDDIAKPVLGYSDSGIYDPDNLPPSFAFYLDGFLAKEIEQAIAQGIKQSEETKGQWESYMSGKVTELRATTAVGPLFGTDGDPSSIAWDQNLPFNAKCPEYNGTKTVTGCVATAMAQIMMYHGYPEKGKGTVGNYPTSTLEIPMPGVDISSHSYVWASMRPQYVYGSYSGNTAEDEVADLMYHCGLSVSMDYNIASEGGSGASTRAAAIALRDNFSYNASINYISRAYYSDEEWEAILKAQIDSNQPVLYDGQDENPENGGHAFVCDGYDNNGCFHFNWGWSGTANGSFQINALNPPLPSPPNPQYKFNEDQGMIVNIIPNNDEIEKNYEIKIQTDISASITTLDRGESFTVNAPVRNLGLFNFTGSIGIAIVDASDNLLSIIGNNPVNLDPTWGYSDLFGISCTIPVDATTGNCRIRVVYKPDDKPDDISQWSIATGAPSFIDVLTLNITNNPPRTHHVVVRTNLTSPTAVDRGESFTVSATYINRGEELITGEIGIALVDNNDQIQEIIGRYNNIQSLSYNSGGQRDIICVVSSAISPGNYKIRAIFRPTGEDWSIIYGEISGVTDICDLTVTSGIVPNNDYYVQISSAFTVSLNPVNQFSPLSVTITLYNSSNTLFASTPFVGEIELGLYDSAGILQEVIGTEKVVIPNNSYNYYVTFSSNSINSPGGIYYMSLYQISTDGVRQKVNGSNNGLPITVIGTLPATTLAWLGTTSSDWNTTTNWYGGTVPSPTDIVTIPGAATNFPDLKGAVQVAEIHFEPGAQIGGQQYLSGKAFVQYDLSNRKRWNMLSIPLGEVYPGDFAFGGYPQTWVRTFTASTDGDMTKGVWNTLIASTTAFSFGDGFVIWLNADDLSGEPQNSGMGLKLLDNISELPFFQHQAQGSPDIDLYDKVHQAHDYANGISTFYNVVNTTGQYARGTSSYTVSRSESAYRLAGAAPIEKQLSFLSNNEAGGNFALVGNPYMAALDFDKLSSANANVIKPCYQVWTGAGYSAYTLNGYSGTITDKSLTQYIAPLQAFLVEKPDSPTSASLQITQDMTAVNNTTALRSSTTEGNKLDIVARNPIAGVLTFIAQREYGKDSFNDFDARKIINDISDVPEIYTLKTYKNEPIAVGANIINSDDLLIPIGLATSYTGNITLSFSGMDTYDANLTLIDAVANKEFDLTGLASYDYVVNYTPGKINGESVAACEDRLFIRISKITTGLPEIVAEKVNVYETNGGFIQVVSGAANPIKEVSVYNLQGTLIYKESSLNSISHTVNRSLPDGMYIVKVISEKNIDNVKLIIR